jgi:hypothetical protein
MVRILSRSLALVFAVALVGVIAVLAVRAARPLEDVKPPEHEALIEQPMNKPDIPAGWIWIDQADGFSVYAPPGTAYHRDHGIDWAGGHFDAPDFSFGYYLGHFPQGLHEDGEPKYVEEPVVIDGRHGIIQRTVLPADHIKDGRRHYSRLLLRSAIYHYDYPGTWEALDLYGRAASPEAQNQMEQVWRSIRFDRREVKDLAPAPKI